MDRKIISNCSNLPTLVNYTHESARHQDEFLRRYLAAMTEIRMLKTELIKLNGKEKKASPTLRLRCAQALAYIFTRGDRTYHFSYMSTTRATAKNWAYKFRHPFRSKKKQDKGGRPKVTEEIVELILTLKKSNGHWGANRIRDELLNMGIRLCKTTIANILRENGFDPTGDRESKWEQWKGEYKDHMWACDFFFVETLRNVTCMIFLMVDTYTKETLSLQVHEGREGIDSFWVAGKISQVGGDHLPGSYLTINSISECKRVFPRFLTLWMNSKKPIYNGSFS